MIGDEYFRVGLEETFFQLSSFADPPSVTAMPYLKICYFSQWTSLLSALIFVDKAVPPLSCRSLCST